MKALGAASREVADRFQALTEVLVQRDPAGIRAYLGTDEEAI